MTKEILQKTIAGLTIGFLVFTFLQPFLFTPRSASASGSLAIPTLVTGVPVRIVTWSDRNIYEQILKTIEARLVQDLISRLQEQVLASFSQLTTNCPSYLKLIGTDICQKVVGDWRAFFSNAKKSADLALIQEVQSSSLPADWKPLLISSLLPLNNQSVGGKFQAAGGLPPQENTWENYTASLAPERNILGMLLILHDEQLEKQEENLQAAEKEAAAGRGYLSDYECARKEILPVSIEEGQVSQEVCVEWRVKTPAATKEQTVGKVTTAQLDLLTGGKQQMTDISGIIGRTLGNLIVDGIFGKTGLLNIKLPSVSIPGAGDPCFGLPAGLGRDLCQQAQRIQPSPQPSPAFTAPSFTFTADPISVKKEGSSALTWFSQAQSCTASDGWSGTKAGNGLEIVKPSQTTNYKLKCGDTELDVTVTVQQ